MSWSSGKDSAWALHVLRQTRGIQVAALITAFNSAADRERRPSVPELRLWPVELPWPSSNAVCEDLMCDLCRHAVAEHITAMAFGDLFLRHVRAYREGQLQGTGREPLSSTRLNLRPT